MLYYRAAAADEGHTRAGHGSFTRMMERVRRTPDMLLTKHDRASPE